MVKKRWWSNRGLSTLLLVLGITAGFGVLAYTLSMAVITNQTPTLLSFAVSNFAGYLFFIISPVELFFAFMVVAGYNPWILISIAIVGGMAAEYIDYLIGYWVSRKVLNRIINHKQYKKYKGHIRKYGNAFIFAVNLSPLSSPFALLAAGMIRYNVKDAMKYAFFGLLLKYVLIAVFLI